ncbi:MAG TPA: Fe-S cluster assembly protein SufD [Thermodesulfobacteriota bacterium]
MEIEMQDIDSYLEGFLKYQEYSAGREIRWFRENREKAIHAFKKLGFPTIHDEDWRFTNLAPIERTPFRLMLNGKSNLSRNDIEPFVFSDSLQNQLVFIDGRFSVELSSLNTSGGVRISNLTKALFDYQDLLSEHLTHYADFEHEAFTALNTAFMEDGAFVSIPKGVLLHEPIHLLYITTINDIPCIANPRNLIILEDNSQANIIEHYVSLGSNVYFSNVVTEVVIGENSTLDHYMIERESVKAYNVSTLRVEQMRNSNLNSHSLLLGGSLVRNNVHPVLAGEGCHSFINGLFMSTGRQHMDNYMKVEHVSPHCDSRQLYNGVLNGKSRGVFHGRIIVHKDAQKTDAKQTNRNLLLSDSAQIDTKPQLEIYADDVKCTHGATIGQIDENAIFYIRSRGLSEESARAMLLYAFTSKSLESMNVEQIRDYIEKLVTEWFAKGNLIQLPS